VKRKTDNFSKFFEKKKKNGAIKEAFKQEKRAVKKERKDAIERHFEEKRQARAERFGEGSGDAAAGGKRPDQTRKAQPPVNRKPFVANQKPSTEQPIDRRPPQKSAAPKAAPGGPEKLPDKRPPFQKSVTPRAVPGKPASGQKVPVAAQKPANAQKPAPPRSAAPGTDLIPLNKYIAHGGICSRRDAAELIRQGKVLLNGQPITEPGTRVSPSDLVQVNGKKITMSRNFAYILLNKPKDYITTTDDPLGRKTVLDLIRQATPERVYPIGRLDRNTSGVLLLTNDGDLAQKLAHPSHEVRKIYHVTLDKALTKADFDAIAQGVTLEDGPAMVDAIAYTDAKDKTQIGLEIHSGRNRIVRRIFEQLGYDVRGLDRVMYAGLTKKNVQRGKWRLLTEKEIRILKYLNSSGRGAPLPRSAKAANAGVTDKPELEEKPVRPAKAVPTGKFKASVKPGTQAKTAPGKASANKTAPGKPIPAKASQNHVSFNPSYRKRPSRKAD
jgi:23S rRNA pseudouridine2605 synthase